ncbi:hypothetical protein BGLA2_1900006 [Burkholderia gladioli]|nr:hypothetical protein BGLA2_1900006 [Burkholderia gladioli]
MPAIMQTTRYVCLFRFFGDPVTAGFKFSRGGVGRGSWGAAGHAGRRRAPSPGRLTEAANRGG